MINLPQATAQLTPIPGQVEQACLKVKLMQLWEMYILYVVMVRSQMKPNNEAFK